MWHKQRNEWESRTFSAGLRLTRARFLAFLVTAISFGSIFAQSGISKTSDATPLPHDWTDKDTGYHVTRLTDEPDSSGLYFNQNAFTEGNNLMVFRSPRGIFGFNLSTMKSRQLIVPPIKDVIVAKHSDIIYFTRPNDLKLYSLNTKSGSIADLGVLPKRASIESLNADETVIAGTYINGTGLDFNQLPPNKKGLLLVQRFEEHLPMVMFTYDLKTGVTKSILQSNDWISHVQFSPKNERLIMYCHEGPWELVDRIWTINSDGTGNTLVHARAEDQEIAGHEFWGPDGETIWYDLQVPKGMNFNLASYNVGTNERQKYHMERDEWSVHFNEDPSGKFFAGDGADYAQIAHSHNGQWIELYRPRLTPSSGTLGAKLVRSGHFNTIKLVNMTAHDYKIEPNVRFSPDGNSVIFTSDALGKTYLFAVDVSAVTNR